MVYRAQLCLVKYDCRKFCTIMNCLLSEIDRAYQRAKMAHFGHCTVIIASIIRPILIFRNKHIVLF